MNEPVPRRSITVNLVGLPKLFTITKHANIKIGTTFKLSASNPQFEFSLDHVGNYVKEIQSGRLAV